MDKFTTFKPLLATVYSTRRSYDGAVVLSNGIQLTIDEVTDTLNEYYKIICKLEKISGDLDYDNKLLKYKLANLNNEPTKYSTLEEIVDLRNNCNQLISLRQKLIKRTKK